MAPRVAVEEIENQEVIEEIDWSPKPVMNPGVDYIDGIAYFTVPFLRNVLKPAKKKDDPPSLVQEHHMMAISSQRTGIWYNKEALENAGFSINSGYLQETVNRWSLASRQDYLKNGAKAPSTSTLFAAIKRIYTTYVEFDNEIFYDLMPLFVMYSYVFRLFESTGYIHFNGTRASGKSRNLSILASLCFNTTLAASMSAASMYRKLEGSPGTTILDESEGFEGERGEDLRRILNAGYKLGEIVTRTEKEGDKFIVKNYNVFGPKVLASINALEDTIQSRCVVIAMRPTVRNIPDFLTSNPELAELRDSLYLWALENMQAIANLRDQWFSSRKTEMAPRIISREWETTAQYIMLADYIGGEKMAKAVIDYFMEYFSEKQHALDATDRLRVTLRSLPRVLATKHPHPGNFYSTKDIHEVIASYMETDATEYFKTKHVTANLNILGFSEKIRTKGGVQIKLDEDAVRKEFTQRRVEPFEEDVEWFEGKTSFQNSTYIIPEPEPVATTVEDEEPHWWEGLTSETD